MANPIFPKEFFTRPNLFDASSGAHKMHVKKEGYSLQVKPLPSFWESLQRKLNPFPDPDLIAAHALLKQIEGTLRNLQTKPAQDLIQEIQSYSLKERRCFLDNLKKLSSTCMHAHERRLLLNLIQKVVNFALALFRVPPLPSPLKALNIQTFRKASEFLSEEERNACVFNYQINYRPNLAHRPKKLTAKNLSKLERGLVKGVSFDFAGRSFCIWCEKDERTALPEFNLMYDKLQANLADTINIWKAHEGKAEAIPLTCVSSSSLTQSKDRKRWELPLTPGATFQISAAGHSLSLNIEEK